MPGGRPIGAQNKDKRFRAALVRQFEKHPELLDQMAERLCATAVSGDMGAIREVADRMDGKVPQTLEGNGENGAIVVKVMQFTANE